jgi:hypothetical protein
MLPINGPFLSILVSPKKAHDQEHMRIKEPPGGKDYSMI